MTGLSHLDFASQVWIAVQSRAYVVFGVVDIHNSPTFIPASVDAGVIARAPSISNHLV